jgi:hypothetical protein
VLTASIIRVTQVTALIVEAVSTLEMLVSYCHTAQQNIPEESHLELIFVLMVNIIITTNSYILRQLLSE